MKALFNGRQLEAHVYIERIPIEQVPVGSQECEKWLYELYAKKVTMYNIHIVHCLIYRKIFNSLINLLNIYKYGEIC